MRKRLTGVIFSILFAMAMSLQSRVHFSGDIDQPLYADTLSPFSAGSALVFIVSFLVAYAIFHFFPLLIAFICEKHVIIAREMPAAGKKQKWTAGIVCVLPFLLSSLLILALDYPGFVEDDSISSLEQATGDMWFSNHHPLIFTLFVTLFVKIGRMISTEFNTCVFLFSLTQVLILSGILGYIMSRLYLRGVRIVVLALIYVYYLVNAPFSLLSVTMWKDPLFSAFLYLLMYHLYLLAESEFALLSDKNFTLRMAVLLFLVSFSRNNGIYIVFPVALLLTLFHAKTYPSFAKRVVFTIALILLIRYPGYALLHVNTAHAEESVGIPMQELAYTISTEDVSDETEILYGILPKDNWMSDYHPFRVDSIKWDKDFDTALLNEHEGEFLHSWMKNFPKHVPAYLRAHLLATYGFWSVQTNNAYEYLELGIVDNVFGIHRVNLLSEAGLPDLSILNDLKGNYCSGTLIWIMLFIFAFLIAYRKRQYVLVLLPGVLLWITLMIATPVAFSFRYCLGIAYAMPFILLLPVLSHEKTAVTAEERNDHKK